MMFILLVYRKFIMPIAVIGGWFGIQIMVLTNASIWWWVLSGILAFPGFLFGRSTWGATVTPRFFWRNSPLDIFKNRLFSVLRDTYCFFSFGPCIYVMWFYLGHADAINTVIAEPVPSITASWNIKEGAIVESFTNATLTFTGVDAVELKNSYGCTWFYEKDVDGNWQLVNNMRPAGYMDATVSGTTLTLAVDPACYTSSFDRKGEYRIIVPVDGVYFNGDKTNLNTEEYILNFVIDNENVELEEIDAVYTITPKNNNTITEIREIVINFTEYETITVAKPDLIKNSNIPTAHIVDSITGALTPAGCIFFKADTLSTNGIRLYTDPSINGALDSYAQEGVYEIRIPAGVVTLGESGINKPIILNYTVKTTTPEITPTIVEGTELYIQLPTTMKLLRSSVTFGKTTTGDKLKPAKRRTSMGGKTTICAAMTNVDAENGIWKIIAPAGTSDSIFNVTLKFKDISAACGIANLKYDGEHNLFTLSSDFTFVPRKGDTATEANGTWGVYPFP